MDAFQEDLNSDRYEREISCDDYDSGEVAKDLEHGLEYSCDKTPRCIKRTGDFEQAFI